MKRLSRFLALSIVALSFSVPSSCVIPLILSGGKILLTSAGTLGLGAGAGLGAGTGLAIGAGTATAVAVGTGAAATTVVVGSGVGAGLGLGTVFTSVGGSLGLGGIAKITGLTTVIGMLGSGKSSGGGTSSNNGSGPSGGSSSSGTSSTPISYPKPIQPTQPASTNPIVIIKPPSGVSLGKPQNESSNIFSVGATHFPQKDSAPISHQEPIQPTQPASTNPIVIIKPPSGVSLGKPQNESSNIFSVGTTHFPQKDSAPISHPEPIQPTQTAPTNPIVIIKPPSGISLGTPQNESSNPFSVGTNNFPQKDLSKLPDKPANPVSNNGTSSVSKPTLPGSVTAKQVKKPHFSEAIDYSSGKSLTKLIDGIQQRSKKLGKITIFKQNPASIQTITTITTNTFNAVPANPVNTASDKPVVSVGLKPEMPTSLQLPKDRKYLPVPRLKLFKDSGLGPVPTIESSISMSPIGVSSKPPVLKQKKQSCSSDEVIYEIYLSKGMTESEKKLIEKRHVQAVSEAFFKHISKKFGAKKVEEKKRFELMKNFDDGLAKELIEKSTNDLIKNAKADESSLDTSIEMKLKLVSTSPTGGTDLNGGNSGNGAGGKGSGSTTSHESGNVTVKATIIKGSTGNGAYPVNSATDPINFISTTPAHRANTHLQIRRKVVDGEERFFDQYGKDQTVYVRDLNRENLEKFVAEKMAESQNQTQQNAVKQDINQQNSETIAKATSNTVPTTTTVTTNTIQPEATTATVIQSVQKDGDKKLSNNVEQFNLTTQSANQDKVITLPVYNANASLPGEENPKPVQLSKSKYMAWNSGGPLSIDRNHRSILVSTEIPWRNGKGCEMVRSYASSIGQKTSLVLVNGLIIAGLAPLLTMITGTGAVTMPAVKMGPMILASRIKEAGYFFRFGTGVAGDLTAQSFFPSYVDKVQNTLGDIITGAVEVTADSLVDASGGPAGDLNKGIRRYNKSGANIPTIPTISPERLMNSIGKKCKDHGIECNVL